MHPFPVRSAACACRALTRAGALTLLAMLLAAVPSGAQRLQIYLNGGPTWRAGGVNGGGFDAVTLEAGVGIPAAPRLVLQVAGGLTAGGVTEALAVGAPCDPQGFCPGGRTGVLVPGWQSHGRIGLGWAVPGTGPRVELHGGVGVHAASVSGPDAVLGLDAGVSVALLRWLDLGVNATRLTSDLGDLRWLVTPMLRLRRS